MCVSTAVHDLKSRKTAFFVVTAIRTPNLTFLIFCGTKELNDNFNYSVLLAITKGIFRCISHSLEANFETDRDFQKATDTLLQTLASETI